eukprot:11172300-Lingulodinium_polyedra.AAC.1
MRGPISAVPPRAPLSLLWVRTRVHWYPAPVPPESLRMLDGCPLPAQQSTGLAAWPTPPVRNRTLPNICMSACAHTCSGPDVCSAAARPRTFEILRKYHSN